MDKRQTEPRHKPRRSMLIAGLLLGAMVVSWCSGFIGYRYAAEQGGVMLASLWRFVLAALLLLPWGWPVVRSLGVRRALGQAWIGVFAIAGYLTPIAKAIEWGLAPGAAALIANLLPVAILVLGFVSGQRASVGQCIGLALCLAGMLIAGLGDLQAQGVAYWLYLLPVLGVLSLAGSSALQRGADQTPVPALGGLFIQVCATIPVFALLAWHEGSLVPAFSQGFVMGVGWLGVFSTLGGYGFYWVCLRRFSMPAVSAALFLTPMVTVLWSALQFDEPLTRSALAGAAVTVLGVSVFACKRRALIDGRERLLPRNEETATSPDFNA